MATTRLRTDEIERLIEAVAAKIRAQQALVEVAEGEITIRIFRRGTGFDVKLVLTT
jgi:hypothetical protein